MVTVLVIVAASVFLLLGLLHGLLTLQDLQHPSAFTPRTELRELMQQSSIGLDRTINLWDAWMGFNLTHSLGLAMYGAAYLHVGVFNPAAFVRSPLLQACAVGIAALYLLISLKFFFLKPVIGTGIGLACFAMAVVLAHA